GEAQVRPALVDGRDAGADHGGLEAPPHRLDLGQFGHRVVLLRAGFPRRAVVPRPPVPVHGPRPLTGAAGPRSHGRQGPTHTIRREAMERILLVTGGSRGIGAATCRLAAAEGYHVAVNYVSDAAAA